MLRRRRAPSVLVSLCMHDHTSTRRPCPCTSIQTSVFGQQQSSVPANLEQEKVLFRIMAVMKNGGALHVLWQVILLLCSLGACVSRQVKRPRRFARRLSMVGQVAIRTLLHSYRDMATGKATLGQMAAACRQHDEVADEDVVMLRGVLNCIALDKVIKSCCVRAWPG